jgi:hypothetical protein
MVSNTPSGVVTWLRTARLIVGFWMEVGDSARTVGVRIRPFVVHL